MAISKNDPNQQVSKSDSTVQHQQPENLAPGTTQAPAPAGALAGPPITNVNTTPENEPAGGTGGTSGEHGDKGKGTQVDQARMRESARQGEARQRAEQAKRKAEESRHLADNAADEARRLAIQASADAEAAERLATAADPEKAVYVVAEGKSLFTLSGTKGAFDRVKSRDFAGGAEELQSLLRAGDIVHRP